MKGASVLAALLAACSPVASPSPATLATNSLPVVGGTEAPLDAAVVALVARRTRCEEPEPLLLCSGSLVAQDVVLTAAHCLDVLGVDGQYEVFLGEQLLPTTQGHFVQVVEVARHPGYVPDTHALDVALLRLAAPVAVEPLVLPTVGEVPEVGATARVVGYGETRDATLLAGRRRQGHTVVTSVEPAAFRAGPAPAMSCVGDSGGPVLVQLGEREVLAGVTVSGDVACRSEAVAVRVDAVLEDFVRPFLAGSRPPPPAHPLAPEALCTSTCADANDCPAGLACVPDSEGRGRCMLLALQEGAFGASCTEDSACGEGSTCARLTSGGPEACRCFTPCSVPAPPGAAGCTAAAGSTASLGLLALGLALRRLRR
ncbi:MAG: trypsin-like serine protease [Myxococcaceae bacterium]|nr:trypsin-like serine protease [Myxococcaceae bacterium]